MTVPAPLAEAAQWGGAFAGIAAGVTAFAWLAKKGVSELILPGSRQILRAIRGVVRLAAIGDEASWPNGSGNLPQFLDRMYRDQGRIFGALEVLVVAVNRILAARGEELISIETGVREDDWDEPHGEAPPL